MHVRPADIADWIRMRVAAAGRRGLAVGIDGGVDTAVVAGLCALAMPGRVAALLMCDPAAAVEAHAVAGHFRLSVIPLDLQPACERLAAPLDQAVGRLAPPHPDEDGGAARDADAALEARLRTAALYFVAERLSCLVAGSLNRCDLTVGLFSKHGTGGADIFPIGHLLASDVRALARDLELPEAIAGMPQTGRLPAADADGVLPVTYEAIERYLDGGPEAVPPATALRIERLIRSTAHTRTPVLTPDVDL